MSFTPRPGAAPHRPAPHKPSPSGARLPRPLPLPLSLRPPATLADVIRLHGQAVAARELQRRVRARDSLAEFFLLREPTYILGEWVADLIRHLEWARATPGARLLIFAPPRHGKSQVVSRLLPPYLLGHNPTHEVLAIAATQNLADEFGLYVRNTLNDPAYQFVFPGAAIDPSSNAVSRITLRQRGGYRGVGVGGQIVGRGADWLIIDDPYADRQEAYKQTTRDALWDWYTTAARNRLAPGGRIIVMHQRFTVDDLADRLLDLARTSPDADQWRVLHYPAIAEPGIVDTLERPHGEVLFPERWPLQELKALRATMPAADWMAMFQQTPSKVDGAFFTVDMFQFYPPAALPKNLTWYVTTDYAVSTSNYADRSAIIAVGVDADGDWWIAPDFIYERVDSLEAVNRTLTLHKARDAREIVAEKGVIERALNPIFRMRMRETRHYASIQAIPRTEGKHIVAAPLHARMQQRKVHFPDLPLIRERIVPTFLNFLPDADNKEDDFIDALANLGQRLAQIMPAQAPTPATLPSEAEEDAEHWAQILRHAPKAESEVPFARLNGTSYARKTG